MFIIYSHACERVVRELAAIYIIIAATTATLLRHCTYVFVAIYETAFVTGVISDMVFCIRSAAIMDYYDRRANLEDLACPRHTYTGITIEEGPSAPDKMVSGLSIYCDQD